MTRIIRRTLAQRIVAANTDKVIAVCPIPAGGVLNSIFLECHVIAGGAINQLLMAMYGVSGYVIPVPDQDAALAYDTAWDQLVPKDEPHLAELDSDTGTADVDPEFEPGMIDINNLFDMVGLTPRQIFRRRKYLTTANSLLPVGGTLVDTYRPVDYFTTKIKKPVRCSMASYAMIALSSPETTSTTTSIWQAPVETQWAILQYMDIFIEQMFMASLGIIEAGAESPYEEAELFISELLEDTVFEEDANSFAGTNWTVYCRGTFDFTVPGRPQLKTLSSEG